MEIKYRRGSVTKYREQFWVASADTNNEPPISPWQLSLLHDDSWLPKDSTVPGPSGKDSTVPGPSGKDSTVPGPKGDTGADGKSIVWKGLFNRRTEYKTQDAVTFDGSSWICVRDCTGREPSDTSRYWQIMAERGQRGERGLQGGAGQRGRSSIVLQNEIIQRVEELEFEVQSIGTDSVSAVFTEAVSKGMPIRIEDDSTVYLAIAVPIDDPPYVKWWGCAGLALDDTAAGQTGRYTTDGTVELSDWSAVIGTQFLTPGSAYLLSETEPGKLVEYDPTASYLMKQVIGKALSETRFTIEIDTAHHNASRDAEFDSECKAGAIVYVVSGDGPLNRHVDKARADSLATAVAFGMTFGNPAAGNVSRVLIHGPVIDPTKDWTNITGSPALVPGPYWLSDTDAGMMTNVEPSTPGSYLVRLGEATDANTFYILIEPPELIT